MIVERELVRVVCQCCGRVVLGRALSSPVSAWCEVLPHVKLQATTVDNLGSALVSERCKGSGDVAVIPRPKR